MKNVEEFLSGNVFYTPEVMTLQEYEKNMPKIWDSSIPENLNPMIFSFPLDGSESPQLQEFLVFTKHSAKNDGSYIMDVYPLSADGYIGTQDKLQAKMTLGKKKCEVVLKAGLNGKQHSVTSFNVKANFVELFVRNLQLYMYKNPSYIAKQQAVIDAVVAKIHV